MTGAIHRFYDIAGEVADENEIAARLGDETALPLGQSIEENWQWAANVPRANDIRQPKRDPIDTAKLHIVFTGRLGDRVAAVHRIDRVIERDRLFARLRAVTQGGLEIY